MDIWHSSDLVLRTIYVSLALLLGDTVFVVIRFFARYYSILHESYDFKPEFSPNVYRTRSQQIADLSRGVVTLKAIASAAPFLGLAGTSYGILAGLMFGYSGSPGRFVALLSQRVSGALFTTVCGILVAIPATISHNLVRRPIEALSGRLRSTRYQTRRELGTFHVAQTLSLRRRFAAPPHFSLIATLMLGSVVALFMTFEPYQIPTGLHVILPLDHCEPGLVDRPIILRVTKEGKVFLNIEPEDWGHLAQRLLQIYKMRTSRVLYLQAQDDVPFRMVAEAIDIVRNSREDAERPLDISVRLITPQTDLGNPVCHAPVWTGSTVRSRGAAE